MNNYIVRSVLSGFILFEVFGFLWINDAKAETPVNLKFGLYSDCLRRGGICSFRISEDSEQANAFAKYKDGGTLVLRLSAKTHGLQGELEYSAKQDSDSKSTHFWLKESLVIDALTSSRLKISDKPVEIPAGKYSVVRVANECFIQFKTFVL
ncbi:hypothetical protein [Nonlabens xiamenensis]|uniref:hypothetical protein n=1 Tax=Nonlabens xiamenensis TaxID=2341043 RepID=UPI000F6096B4|nr:hypothetical protein [Nonlabens xiamenensis]